MRIPMPSPRGTNRANLFVTTNPRGAYDEMPEGAVADLLLFLKPKLSEEDFNRFCEMGKFDAGIIAEDEDDDQPPKFPGRPERGGGQAQDGRRGIGGLSGKTLAHVMSIKVNP